jgi:hypothetical protein
MPSNATYPPCKNKFHIFHMFHRWRVWKVYRYEELSNPEEVQRNIRLQGQNRDAEKQLNMLLKEY